MPIYSAIDIGSNAIRCGVRNSSDSKIQSERRAVRLGGDVFETGQISEETLQQALKGLSSLRDFALSCGAEKIRAVGTSALREAENRDEFIKTVQKQIDLKVEIISGEEEGRLIHRAVLDALPLGDVTSVLLDVGGGSIEVSLSKSDELLLTESASLGAVRLLPILKRPAGEKLIRRLIKQTAERLLSRVQDNIRDQEITTLIATGGNLESLGDLKVKLKLGDDPKIISLEHLTTILETVQSLSYEDRIKKLNLKPDRADVIYPAALVVHYVSTYLNLKEIIVPGVGLKEGVLLNMFNPTDTVITKKKKSDSSFRSAANLAVKYKLDIAHAEKVKVLATDLFDLLSELHKLPNEYRSLFHLAAYLHDIGQFISLRGHHKHSETIINSANISGLTQSQRSFVAVLARYHRKSPPSIKHALFAQLSPEDQAAVLLLAPLLRIADALDRSRENKIEIISVVEKEKSAFLELYSPSDPSFELWAFDKKKEMFEKTYKMKIIPRIVEKK